MGFSFTVYSLSVYPVGWGNVQGRIKSLKSKSLLHPVYRSHAYLENFADFIVGLLIFRVPALINVKQD